MYRTFTKVIPSASLWPRQTRQQNSQADVMVVRLLAVLAGLVFLSCASTAAVAVDPNEMLWDDVKVELQKRQKRFHSVSLEFEVHSFDRVNNSQIPAVRRREWKVRLNGENRVRIEEKGDIEPRINSAGKLITVGERVTVHDGLVSYSLMPNFGGEYTAGFIDAKDRSSICSVVLTPLALCFRPVQWIEESDAAVSKGDVHVARALLRGRECVTATWSSGGFLTSVWLDPARKYAPLQARVEKPTAKRELRWQIDYGDDVHSEIPKVWRCASRADGGKIVRERSAKVRSCSFDGIPDSAFLLDFPIGTYVTDRVLQQNYIILEDGQTRVVKDEEWQAGKTYAEILESR